MTKRFKQFLAAAALTALGLVVAQTHTLAYTLTQTFFKTDPSAVDDFGFKVALDGNRVLVGATNDDIGAINNGAAYLFDSTSGDLLQTFLSPTPAFENDFGYSIAIDGDKVLIGAPGADTGASDSGAAYLFDAVTGGLLRTFSNPMPTRGDEFGITVAIEGNNILIGKESDANGGSVRLFDATTGALVRTFFNPTGINGDFSRSLSLDGNRFLVGSHLDDTAGTDAGAAYLFDLATGNLLETFLNPTPGFQDGFGFSLDLDGDQVLIGAFGDDTTGPNDGAAYLFDAATGDLFHTLLSPTPSRSFGISVALEDNNALVGTFINRNVAHLFDATTGDLVNTFSDPTIPPGTSSSFGISVALEGDRVLIGDISTPAAGIARGGAAFLFERERTPEPSTLLGLATLAMAGGMLLRRDRKTGI